MYFKITNEKENHNGLQYQDGVVKDIIPFNADPKDSCCAGGIYFSNEEYVLSFLDYGPWIRQIEMVPGGQHIKDPQGDKWRADRVFLHPRKELWTGETFQWLQDNGVNFSRHQNVLIKRACAKRSVSVIKFFLDKGIDINNSGVLIDAVEKNFLDGVNFLLENGADVHIGNNNALRYAVGYERTSIVEALVKHGADVNATMKRMWSYSDIDELKILVEYGASIWFLPFRPMMKMFWHRLKFNYNKLFNK